MMPSRIGKPVIDRSKPVMEFYEEPNHLRIVRQTRQGLVTTYLARNLAAGMMEFIKQYETEDKVPGIIKV
jgi:hypothetical protein